MLLYLDRYKQILAFYLNIMDYKKQAYLDINNIAHNRGTLKIIDDDGTFYEIIVIDIKVDQDLNLTFKVLELNDSDFRDTNLIFRLSIEELIEARVKYLQKTN
jgi:hypothetical protein